MNLRRIFVAGVLVTLPLAVTAYVLWLIFSYLDGLLQPVLTTWVGFRIPGIGFLALVLFILLVGLFASNFLGARVVRGITHRLERIPLWSPLYRAIRDISEVLLKPTSKSFRSVALIEWPRKGIYAMVFVTSESGTPGDTPTGRELVSVLLPTTPNPTSGFYMMVPREDVIYLDLGVEQALKVIISGGAAFEPGAPATRTAGSQPGS